MWVQLTKDNLIHAMQHVIKAVSLNSPIPILTGVHIQARLDGITFTASNTSMTIQTLIPQNCDSVHIQREGVVVIPSKYFYEVIHKLNAETVIMETKDAQLMNLFNRLGRYHFRKLILLKGEITWKCLPNF
ncbi:hypothetical protein [Paenibacillus lemnae]|uniref:DNA polymerase III subunit beta n=1 Tax=Paenibacillus lemnae TaxID=1330551 RepID=A0A848M1Z0_PAELE|nr:hypothetical protein [Paenibacillus lemnae]